MIINLIYFIGFNANTLVYVCMYVQMSAAKRQKKAHAIRDESGAYSFGIVLDHVTLAVYAGEIKAKLEAFFSKFKAVEYVFQHEIGETGFNHVQGFIHFQRSDRIRPSTLANQLHAATGILLKYCNVQVAHSNHDLGRYCTKGDPKISGRVWSSDLFEMKVSPTPTLTDGDKEVIRVVEANMLNWQKLLFKYLEFESKKGDARGVPWFFHEVGHTGKTWTVKYIKLKFKAFTVGAAKCADMAAALDNYLDIVVKKDPKHVSDYVKVVLIDMTRTQGKSFDEDELYNFIEQVRVVLYPRLAARL